MGEAPLFRPIPDGGWQLPAGWLLAGLTAIVGLLAFCADRIYNGDFFLQLLGGRFVAQHGFTFHDPFPTIVQGRPWLNEQWLAELIFYGITRAIGFAGLATAYATMLALSGGILLWACRKKGALLLLAAATCFLLGVLTFVHPRAAGFSVLGFSALAAFLAWTAADTLPSAKRVAWALIGAPLGIALWANLHGGFLAGLLLIALFTLGLAIDVWRGQGETRHVWLGAACVLLSLAAVTLATPLGSDIWTYIVSLSNPAIPSISTEWGPTYRSLPEMLYLGAAAALALSLWWRSRAPRRAMPLLVVVGFLGFGLLAARNLIFLGPVVAFMIVCAAPDRPARSVGRFTAASLAAALSLAATLALVLGPPHSARPLGSPLVSYAIAHPPRTGRIAAYAGIGSYLLWRDPRTPTVLDGWLEHFTPFQLIGTYAILDGRATTNRMLNRLGVGAVIAVRNAAIQRLRAQGFVEMFASPTGSYLVRTRASGPVSMHERPGRSRIRNGSPVRPLATTRDLSGI